MIKPFIPNATFLYPLKTSENLTIFWCFQGLKKGCIGTKWVNRHSNNRNALVHKQISSSFISHSEFTPPMSSSTLPFSPVNRIGALSNRFQPSSTQPVDEQSYPLQFPQVNNNWLNWLYIDNLSTHFSTSELFSYIPTCFLLVPAAAFYIKGYVKEENAFILLSMFINAVFLLYRFTFVLTIFVLGSAWFCINQTNIISTQSPSLFKWVVSMDTNMMQ